MSYPSWLIAFLVPSICGFSQTLIRHGTAIAVERTDDQIAIAADSRVVDENNKIMPDTCKIRSAGEWYFTLNGMASTKELDLFAIVEAILRQQGDIADRSEAIVRSLTPALNAALQSDPALRDHAIVYGGVVGVTVVGAEQQVLKLVSIVFTLTDAGVIHEQHMCPGECPQNRAGMHVPRVDTNNFDWRTDPLTAVRTFVQMEIDRHVIDIGPPLQLLEIDRRGNVKWMEKPDVCKSQK
jgi:hypothetical protein